MFVNREPHRREVPHENGAWIDICKLSWTQLADARKAGLKENAERMKLFGAEWISALLQGRKEEAEKIVDEQKWDPSAFGTGVLLELGIVAWSYEEKIIPDNIANVDEPTIDWVKQEIIDLNKPPSEEEEKNS